MNSEARVYYCRDTDGRLIYIGFTGNWTKRVRGHRAETEWWPQVKRVTFSPWMSRGDALELEGRSIRLNRPRFNVRHNPDARVVAA